MYTIIFTMICWCFDLSLWWYPWTSSNITALMLSSGCLLLILLLNARVKPFISDGIHVILASSNCSCPIWITIDLRLNWSWHFGSDIRWSSHWSLLWYPLVLGYLLHALCLRLCLLLSPNHLKFSFCLINHGRLTPLRNLFRRKSFRISEGFMLIWWTKLLNQGWLPYSWSKRWILLVCSTHF
jgi:hypothetical protein